MEEAKIPNGLNGLDFATRPKSMSRHIIEKMYPEAFCKGKDGHYDVILEDTLQFLKSVSHQATNPALVKGVKLTGRGLIKCIKKSAEFYLSKSSCRFYVMLCDKIEYVAKAKGETQSGRDKDKLVTVKDSEFVTGAGMKKTREMIEEYIDKEQVEEETLEKTLCDISVKKAQELNFVPEDGIGYEERRPYLELDKNIPRDWDAALTDRENTAKHIIAWIAFQLFFSSDPECRVSVPHGKFFMFDGHCLKRALFEELIEKTNSQDYSELFSKIDEPLGIKGMPLVMFVSPPKTTGTYEGPKVHMYFEPELYNKHGEADFTFFWYINRLMVMYDVEYFGIFSNDTDILFYSLWHNSKYMNGRSIGYKAEIIWKYAPNIDWALTFYEPNISFSSFVHINSLHFLICGIPLELDLPTSTTVFPREYKTSEEKKSAPKKTVTKKPVVPKEYNWSILRRQIAKTGNPIQNLVLCMLASGCDYIKGYYGITVEKFLFAMARNFDYIGDLAGYELGSAKTNLNMGENETLFNLNGDAYSKLVLTAYMYSKPKRFLSDANTKKRKRMEDDDPNIEDIDPTLNNYKKIKEATKSLGAKNRLPSKEFILASCLHLLFYVEMLNQLGSDRIEEPDHNTFAYSKIYESQDIGRKNIQKMFVLNAKMFV